MKELERHRKRLIGLAYRMLGSVADAEDVVQEAWLRHRKAGAPALENPAAWLTKTCTRLCLDRLNSAQRKRESYVGLWLPEPLVDDESDRLELDESLSMALLLTIQKLRPAERAAFLLHDVFGTPYAEIAELLDRTPEHCRQLASRARKNLGNENRSSPPKPTEVERLSEAFFTAIRQGDLEEIRSLLSEEVVLLSDGGGKAAAAPRPIEGRDTVAHFLHSVLKGPLADTTAQLRPLWFNGAPGVLLEANGEILTAFHFRIDGKCISSIFAQRNPEKLSGLRRRS